MSKLTLSVVIPAHNEADNLPRTISNLVVALEAANVPHEIVIVDDHSSDETVQVVEVLAKRFPTVRVVQNERPNGFGQAIHTGLDSFSGDAVCLVMADGSDEPKDLVNYYRQLEKGYECVFGSRFVPQAQIVNYPKHKLLLNRLANLFIRLLFGLQYNDITNAFKCYRRNVIEGIRPILAHHFNLTVELPLKAIVRGYSYTVIPTNWYGRLHGVSKLRIREMGSRYLFIVLYVLLERLLSRGDYRRAGASAPVDGEVATPPPRRIGWAWLAYAAVVLVHALFVYTYPLNSGGGDAIGYYHVVINRTSNLLFAPGYPVLAGLPLRIDSIYNAVMQNQAAFRKFLLVAQHGFELACLLVLLFTLTRVYNRATAAIAVLFIGCSPRALGVTSSVYPEWLQANFLMLSMAFAALAYTGQSRARKYVLYSLSLAAFVWCVLTKFNAIVFAPVILAAILFEKTSWMQRAKYFLAAALFAFVNYLGFVTIFHKPATGTFALTHDRSWVLLTKLQHVYGKLPYPDGLATKRWLALSSVLPPDYNVASVGIFMKLDSVPAAIREQARADAAFLLDAKEEVLDGILQLHPLPPAFQLHVSSIPISYYIGLAESDELGVRVFRESVLHRPGPYLQTILRNSWLAITQPTTEPTFPATQNVTNVSEKLEPVGGNRFRLVREPYSPLGYDSQDPMLIWGPGLRFFSALNAVPVKRAFVVFVMAVGVVIALASCLRSGWSFRAAAPLVLGLFLIAFLMLSSGLLDFRWKEWRCALPVAGLLVAITLGWAIPHAVRGVLGAVSPGPSPVARSD